MASFPKANESAHISIEMEIKEMLKNLPPQSKECCIYRTPEKLRKVNGNGETYTPRAVSIGPFHRGQQHLQAMEEHKLRYLQSFLPRTGSDLGPYVERVRTWERDARNCYAETIDLSSDAFVKMLVMDGSFIVELLLRSSHIREGKNQSDHSDRIFSSPWLIDDLGRDMILLENQLPFIVLERMLRLVDRNLNENPSMLKLTYEHFKSFLTLHKYPDNIRPADVKHFLDFLRHCHLPSPPKKWRKGGPAIEFSPSATRLNEAGIKFKVRESSCLLDVNFKSGVLEIPNLEIDDLTETLFRNLIAYEQCHCNEKYIIHYMALLDSMINTPKDVELLIDQRIITSRLGSNEDVMILFNNICKEVVFGHDVYFSSLCQILNAYCRTPWHRWKANLKRDYFHTPWAAVSVVAAVILLMLTFIQTVCSIKSLIKSP
ncbi:unnamed protein product [Ilex paraguariensis]|uniref:Uncharacterized protein n=1 Tax=Ilex paraguariensis TaxID=185542 RepID=A0ABC8SBZ7_9AQUA